MVPMNVPAHHLMNDANDLHVDACCGCGIINVGFGPMTLKMTRSAFLSILDTLNEVADQLRLYPGTQSAGCASTAPAKAMIAN